MSKSEKRQSRINKYWYNVYKTALRYFGIELKEIKKPTKASLKRARKIYKAQTADLTKGIKPTVREIYNREVEIEKEQADYTNTPRDDDYRTETAQNMYDISLGVINSFIDLINDIYWDTMDKINMASQGIEGIEKKYAIAIHKTDEITFLKDKLIAQIETMINDSNNNLEYVAQAIKANGDLDYTEAIRLVPPSDIEVNFEQTTENLQMIWNDIVLSVQNKAEQDWS